MNSSALIRPALAVAISACLFLGAACTPTPQTAPAPEASPKGGPTLWRLADADTEIFLFGTIHLLPADLDWKRPELKAALAEADVIYLESRDDPASETTRAILAEAMRPPGTRLAERLGEADAARLETILAEAGFPLHQFESYPSWFAAMTLSRISLESIGIRQDAGVETWLESARREDTPIRGLENRAEVAARLSDLPEATQVRLLENSLAELETLEASINALVSAWASGDQAGLARAQFADMREDLPDVYQVLIADRNRAWAAEIIRLLEEEEGTFLIAVGAGHFLHEEGLPALLEGEGYPLTRY